MTDWEGKMDHCLDKSYVRHCPPEESISNLLLQYMQGKEGTQETLNTITFKSPSLGLRLLRSSDTDLEDNHMQIT